MRRLCVDWSQEIQFPVLFCFHTSLKLHTHFSSVKTIVATCRFHVRKKQSCPFPLSKLRCLFSFYQYFKFFISTRFIDLTWTSKAQTIQNCGIVDGNVQQTFVLRFILIAIKATTFKFGRTEHRSWRNRERMLPCSLLCTFPNQRFSTQIWGYYIS